MSEAASPLKPPVFMRPQALFAVFLIILAAGCAEGGEEEPLSLSATTEPAPSESALTSAMPEPSSESSRHVVTPAGPPSGNRLAEGRAAALAAEPIEIALAVSPSWVVGAELGGSVVWVVTEAEGTVIAFAEANGQVADFELDEPVSLPPAAPPTLLVDDAGASILQAKGAPLAGHTVVDGTTVTIAADGTMLVGEDPVAGATALPDGRIVVSSRREVAFLAEPTDRLAHGVLGDRIESESVVVLEPGGTSIQAVLDAPDETAFEAVAPLWADIDGDGADEILVTASDAQLGARLTVFKADGDLIAQSAPIGSGNRWLNQLAVAPVGPNGEIEVIEVRTPHIGGIVNWYRLEGDTIELQASAGKYSSHRIGSRNLDQGLVVDADGDGRLDVVVPTQDQETIVALTRVEDGAEIVLSMPLGARLSTNLSAVARSDGTTTLALGTEDGRLLIWP